VALIEVADTLQMIEQLTTLGIGVALDDFGTASPRSRISLC